MQDKSSAFVRRLNTLPARSFFLLGPRGSGKSTWLRHVLGDATWISLLDEARYQEYLVRPGAFRGEIARVPPGSWVVVDEVQRLPGLLNEVHAAIEERGLRFALCGSSARKLRRAGVNLLAGRALSRTMCPFVPAELGPAFDLDRALRFGTLPLIWGAEDPEDVLQAYTRLYLREEVQAEALVRRVPAFARFLEVAALFHGQVLDVSALARDAGVARGTVQDYLQILEDTLMAARLAPFTPQLRVKQPQRAKLFWVDAGLPRAIKQQLAPPTAEECGPLFEGLVLTVLRAHRDHCRLYERDSYWSAGGGGQIEVDFVLQRGAALLGIEVKAASRYRSEFGRGLAAMHRARPLARRIVVYRGARSLRTDAGVDVLTFTDFCALLRADLWPE